MLIVPLALLGGCTFHGLGVSVDDGSDPESAAAMKPALPAQRTGAQTADEQIWDMMEKCAREATHNPAEAVACRKTLRKESLTGRIRDIRANARYIDIEFSISESVLGSRRVTCGLDVRKNDDRAARLAVGDTVTVRGVVDHSLESTYFTDIVLRPCDITVAKPAPGSKSGASPSKP